MTELEIMQLLKPYVTSRFGDTQGRPSPHKGIDVAMFVCAAGAGKVIAAVNSVPDSYNGLTASGAGNFVWLQHADGWVTKYMHLDGGTVRVSVGQTVTAGQALGMMGNTGNSTGCHLHFQAERNGVPVDPLTAPPLSMPVAQPTTPTTPTGAYKVGDAVKILSTAKTWSNGAGIASFVYGKTLYITKLGAATANLSTSKGGAVTGNAWLRDIVKI